MSIEVSNITKTFNNFTALNDIGFQVATGELVALLGPSGCGKTTLLRIIAGLEFQDKGNILFHGEDAQERSARERQVGFVFQHYALFRHMTVFENVAFGLAVRPRAVRPSKDHIQKKVRELLHLVQMEHMEKRYPSQLSGGQRQRVALARALAIEPKVLLLDEPFGALDTQVRKELRQWLRRLHDEIHVTSLFVTHDQEEALEVADKIVIMNKGKIEQIGTPEEVYHNPSSPFVYNFLGNVNLFHGRVEEGKTVLGKAKDTSTASVYVRPHLLDIDHTPKGEHSFKARVKHINTVGPLVKVELVSEWGNPVQVEISQERSRALRLKKDENVFVTPKEIKVFLEDYSI